MIFAILCLVAAAAAADELPLDLQLLGDAAVRDRHPEVFMAHGGGPVRFEEGMRNPCFRRPAGGGARPPVDGATDQYGDDEMWDYVFGAGFSGDGSWSGTRAFKDKVRGVLAAPPAPVPATTAGAEDGDEDAPLECLPYAYILSRCGLRTREGRLLQHINRHPDVVPLAHLPLRANSSAAAEGAEAAAAAAAAAALVDVAPDPRWFLWGVGGKRDLRSLTVLFDGLAATVDGGVGGDAEKKDTSAGRARSQMIGVENGGHALLWEPAFYIEDDGEPDGILGEVPLPQLLHALQPGARLIVELCDPVDNFHWETTEQEEEKAAEADKAAGKDPADADAGESAAAMLAAKLLKDPLGIVARADAVHRQVDREVRTFRACMREHAGLDDGGGGGGGGGGYEVDARVAALAHGCVRDILTGVRPLLPEREVRLGGGGTQEQEQEGHGDRWEHEGGDGDEELLRMDQMRVLLGLHGLWVDKWLRAFPGEDRVLILRGEDYDADPRAYVKRALGFLGVAGVGGAAGGAPLPEATWDRIMAAAEGREDGRPGGPATPTAPSHLELRSMQHRLPMYPETHALLEAFYAPYERHLARMRAAHAGGGGGGGDGTSGTGTADGAALRYDDPRHLLIPRPRLLLAAAVVRGDVAGARAVLAASAPGSWHWAPPTAWPPRDGGGDAPTSTAGRAAVPVLAALDVTDAFLLGAAVKRLSAPLVALLLREGGLDPNARGAMGRAPLHFGIQTIEHFFRTRDMAMEVKRGSSSSAGLADDEDEEEGDAAEAAEKEKDKDKRSAHRKMSPLKKKKKKGGAEKRLKADDLAAPWADIVVAAARRMATVDRDGPGLAHAGSSLHAHTIGLGDFADELDARLAPIAALLLDAGARVGAADRLGVTPLHASAFAGLNRTTHAMVAPRAGPGQAAADVARAANAGDALYGATPLMMAAMGGSVGVAAALLGAGADPDKGARFPAYESVGGGPTGRALLEAPGSAFQLALRVHGGAGAAGDGASVVLGGVRVAVRAPRKVGVPDPSSAGANSSFAALATAHRRHGDGGWAQPGARAARRLLDRGAFPGDFGACDIDQIDAADATPELVYRYLSENRPVLLRGSGDAGLVDDWRAFTEAASPFTRAALGALDTNATAAAAAAKAAAESSGGGGGGGGSGWGGDGSGGGNGRIMVPKSEIPYPDRYGGKPAAMVPFAEYLDYIDTAMEAANAAAAADDDAHYQLGGVAVGADGSVAAGGEAGGGGAVGGGSGTADTTGHDARFPGYLFTAARPGLERLLRPLGMPHLLSGPSSRFGRVVGGAFDRAQRASVALAMRLWHGGDSAEGADDAAEAAAAAVAARDGAEGEAEAADPAAAAAEKEQQDHSSGVVWRWRRKLLSDHGNPEWDAVSAPRMGAEELAEAIRWRALDPQIQVGIGAVGSGAPVHYHNHAVNALLFGAKRWFLFPPHHQVMSHKQIHRWAAEDFAEYAARGVPHGSCVQLAGDTIVIPAMWGHGVLNLRAGTIGVAQEIGSDYVRFGSEAWSGVRGSSLEGVVNLLLHDLNLQRTDSNATAAAAEENATAFPFPKDRGGRVTVEGLSRVEMHTFLDELAYVHGTTEHFHARFGLLPTVAEDAKATALSPGEWRALVRGGRVPEDRKQAQQAAPGRGGDDGMELI